MRNAGRRHRFGTLFHHLDGGFGTGATLALGGDHPDRERLQLLAGAKGGVRSVALDLAAVAAGRLDGYWEWKINPWDIAAGVLMVTEAGGQVTMPDGSPLDLFARQIVASNGLIQKEMVDVLMNSKPWPITA